MSPSTSFDANIVVVEPEQLSNYSIPSAFALFAEFPPPGAGFEGYVSIADPIDACTPLLNSPQSIAGTIVLVKRGNCEFYRKALHVYNAGGVAFLASNNSDSFLPVPAWGSEKYSEVLPIYGASIPGKDGEDIRYLVQDKDIAVKLRLSGPNFVGSLFP